MLRQFSKVLEPLRHRLSRALTGEGAAGGSVGSASSPTREERLRETLRRALPGITYLSVEDISGGCGAMFEISVEAREFSGLSRVNQHRLVTDTLRQEIQEMHGVRIHTATPAASSDH